MDYLIFLVVFIIFALLVKSELAKLRAASALCQAYVFKLRWGRPFWDEVLNLLPKEVAYLETQGRVGGQFLGITIERWRSHTTIEIEEVHDVQPGATPRTRWIRIYGDDSPPRTIWSLQLDEGQKVPGDWPTLEVRLSLPTFAFRHAKVGRIQLCSTGGRFGWLSDSSIPWPGHSSEPRPENIFLDIPLDTSGSREDSNRGFEWSLSVHDIESVAYDFSPDTPKAASAHSTLPSSVFIRSMRFLGHYFGQRRSQTGHRQAR